jgi:acyl-coenzyme A thioesterase PaaI-like protein
MTDAGVESRFHAHDQWEVADDARAAALSGLAERVRELTEAVVHTDVPDEEIAAVSAEIASLTGRLSAAWREYPRLLQAGAGAPEVMTSPVTGTANPIAPPVEMFAEPDGTVRAKFTLNAVYEGPPTFVHGGVSALVLDQLLGMAAAVSGKPGMTATLEMRYRRPTPLGVPLTAEGRATRSEGRRSWADGRIIDPDGRTTVEATAMFVTPRPPA